MSIYDIPLKTIEGRETTLAEHKDKALLVVNVASECGYTPQYAGLQALHAKYAARGFAVLGVPSNDFGAQEPGDEGRIKAFCTSKFGVAFPMYAKIPVKGAGKHALYQHLIDNAPKTGEVQWNFEKFLVAPGGRVAGRYVSDVAPEDAKLAADIEGVLP